MVKEGQVRLLVRYRLLGESPELAAAKSGMSTKTARKYLNGGKMPDEMQIEHNWRTRGDPFAQVWEELEELLKDSEGKLEAKTAFDYLQRKYSGQFRPGQLRTLQRRFKEWRALKGSHKEVFFSQVHQPGKLAEFDFTRMNSLGVTIQGVPFEHMVWHFVLTYSNWESVGICFSESFESFSHGVQSALWELGAAPLELRIDCMSAAVKNINNRHDFTKRLEGLLEHYDMRGSRINPRCANENGDVEQRHNRLKKAVEQVLLLRGSRDFNSRDEYINFLREIVQRLNEPRREKLSQELLLMKHLPARRLETAKRCQVKVSSASTIVVEHNIYSVDSRLIGENVEVRIFAEHLDLWYAQRKIDQLPRLRGRGKHRINYRHIIDWLSRKPGAFENYRFRDDLFPTTNFRLVYDRLRAQNSSTAVRQYLSILLLAAYDSEDAVDKALALFLRNEEPIGAEQVKELIKTGQEAERFLDVFIAPVDLLEYDALLTCGGYDA
jgi:hypothetical protein